MRNLILGVTTSAFILSGCSTIMPYDSEFTCNKGAGKGICGSMSEIYQGTLNSQDSNETNRQALEGEKYISTPVEQEEIMYALYRKEKVSQEKNVQQDERLAKLEMQSKLLVASNSNMAGKLAGMSEQKMPENYPVYIPEPKKQSCEPVVKKKKAYKATVRKCGIGDMCEVAGGSTLNVRSEPCPCSEIVGHLASGNPVKIESKEKGWLKISKGWVDGSLMKRKAKTTKITVKSAGGGK